MMDNISIKAQIFFAREIRNVKLADGGGPAEFELVTYTLGQTGDEVTADSSGKLAPWRLPGALEVLTIDMGIYRSMVTDSGDRIFQQLPPRLLLQETVLIIDFRVTQACVIGDVLILEDPSGTFEMFQENASVKQIGDGYLLDFPSSALAKPPSSLEISVLDVIIPGVPYKLQLNCRLRRQIQQPSGDELSRKFFNFVAMRERDSGSLPLNTNDGLVPTSQLTKDSWASSSGLTPFHLEDQVGAPVTQIQVTGDIKGVDNLWLLAPAGVVIVAPCGPTPCDNITEDFGGTGRQAAGGLRPTGNRFGLRVELPASWDAGRDDWVALVPEPSTESGIKASYWASDTGVSLRTMPASVVYAAVALTQAVELSVSLSPSAAALALLGKASQSYVQVRPPAGYNLRCSHFQSFSLSPSALVDCKVESNEAIVGISNADLAAAGTLYFTFGVDTPAADPSPNTFLVALRDVNNITLDAAVSVPGMHIPQPRVIGYVSILVVDFENIARLQAWGEAALQQGVLRASIALALSIGEEGVSVDAVRAVLGISDVRRLQSSGAIAGQLQVNFSAYSNTVPLADLSDGIVSEGFSAGLQTHLGPSAISAGLLEIQVIGVSVPSTPRASLPPNITTPTLRWSSSEANSSGTVSVNLIFQRSTDAIRAILIQMPDSYSHRLEAVDDVTIIQRGAANPFPLGRPEDGASIQTQAARSVRVLLTAGALVAEGGYGFEIPMRMPSNNPIQNIWEVSLCSGVFCDDARHPSVITSFAIKGFNIGDPPNLIRPSVSGCGSRRWWCHALAIIWCLFL